MTYSQSLITQLSLESPSKSDNQENINMIKTSDSLESRRDDNFYNDTELSSALLSESQRDSNESQVSYSDWSIIESDPTITINQTQQDSSNIKEETESTSSLTSTVLKRSSSLIWCTATSSIGRKAIFTTAMYLAGGSIVSTVGLVPVLVAGAVVWIL
ncbi:Hypothetical protein HVR_LOCUS1277 [uncultured virus]|nr:Hypothetical protein HVR_LOCUS1277 [uncultured virus]